MLVAKNLSKMYAQGNHNVNAVRDAHLAVEHGQFCAIIGKSGCGKSTLLRMLGAMEAPDEGSVLYKGKSLYSLKDKEQAAIRGREFGFVFQSFNLISELNVFDNISLPRILTMQETNENDVVQVAASVGIADKLKSYPNQLSGGEQQRVAIARALICTPKVIFADEPTGNLDEQNRDIVINLLMESCKSRGLAVVLVTHDISIAHRSDTVFHMIDGRIEP